jgi:LPXTG-site transpeptidase (sortase) family protein
MDEQSSQFQYGESESINSAQQGGDANNQGAALAMLRQKIGNIHGDSQPAESPNPQPVQPTDYGIAPSNQTDAKSKHRLYMDSLYASGKSPSQIQSMWQTYYYTLSDYEKQQVWDEFYGKSTSPTQSPSQPTQQTQAQLTPNNQQSQNQTKVVEQQWTTETPEEIQNREEQQRKFKYDQETLNRPPEFYNQNQPVASTSQPQQPVNYLPKQEVSYVPKNSFQQKQDEIFERTSQKAVTKSERAIKFKSLLFGLSMGALLILFLLFSFFNERFIAPFLTPSRIVSSTPIIVDPQNVAVGPEPKVIIPKINVEVPVIFGERSINEEDIQRALEGGAIHYPTTSLPGELGNGAIFGHSSNNLLNTGKYKFAFVLLNRLEDGDVFYVQRDGIRYSYRVYESVIVPPTEVSVLDDQEKPSTMALITCDPPGTTINRLVVYGEQISPDPLENIDRDRERTSEVDDNLQQLPSDAPTLWQRINRWFSI